MINVCFTDAKENYIELSATEGDFNFIIPRDGLKLERFIGVEKFKGRMKLRSKKTDS